MAGMAAMSPWPNMMWSANEWGSNVSSDQEFSVMDLMRAGGMSLESAYGALYEEDMDTFTSKLGDRVSGIAKVLSGGALIEPHGVIEPEKMEVVEAEPSPCVPDERIPMRACRTGLAREVAVDATPPICEKTVQALKAEGYVVQPSSFDGTGYTIQQGSTSVPVVTHPQAASIVIDVGWSWGPGTHEALAVVAGACRGAIMYFERHCLEEVKSSEMCSHLCLRNWARLFGHLGNVRVLDEPWPPNQEEPEPDDSGGAICVMFDDSHPVLDGVQKPREPLMAGMWPTLAHNGFDVSITPTPQVARAAINCLVGQYPGMLLRDVPFDVGDVGVFLRLSGKSGYILKRDYLIGREEGHYVSVLRERGEWTWFSCAVDDSMPQGVYVVNCRLQHDTPEQEVNALMECSEVDTRLCGYVASLEFLDCLSSPLPRLYLRQAYMRAHDLPTLAPDNRGAKFFLSDVIPGSCGFDRVVPDSIVVTPGGELLVGNRRDALLCGQVPLGRVAHLTPRWDVGMYRILGKQWGVLRELWSRLYRVPPRLLAHPGTRAIAQSDFYRWAAGEYVIDGSVDDEVYTKWLIGEMQKPDSEVATFVPPPVVAVLGASTLDARFWCSESLFHLHDSCGDPLHTFGDKFLDLVGPGGGSIFSPQWQARYDMIARQADPGLLLKLIEKWGSIPPIGLGDGCGWAGISDMLETPDHESGWPVYGECFDHYVKDRESDSPPGCAVPLLPVEECWLWSNVAVDTLKLRLELRGH